MKSWRNLFVLFILVCYTSALAQETVCAPLVQQALATVDDVCSPTGRNQACYGYVSLDATPRAGAQDFTFSQRGDLARLADLQTLRLSALDPAANTWGIALMRVQANLPDTLPGQNVTFLLFGDVEITNAVEASAAPVTLEVTAGGNINIRTGPGTGFQIAGSLRSGSTATANGRNADGSWLRIQIPETSSLGWVSAPLVTPAGEISSLAVVDAASQEVPFAPMQAFYFKTGVGEVTCADAPADGILIQTPTGGGKINLRANDVDIQLGSTAYLQAQPNAQMGFSVLEGEGTVTSAGVTVVVPEGTWVQIPMDANLRAAGAPGEPQPYDDAPLQMLPVSILPRPITIAAPASEDDMQGHSGGSGLDFSGGLPGMGGNISGLDGMDLAFFCPLMDRALSDAGYTRQAYIELVSSVIDYVPAANRADVQEFLDLLSACP